MESSVNVARVLRHPQLRLDVLERLPPRPVHRGGVPVRRLEVDVPVEGYSL